MPHADRLTGLVKSMIQFCVQIRKSDAHPQYSFALDRLTTFVSLEVSS